MTQTGLIQLYDGSVITEPFDVRRYGAVGDGVTDDTAAIQSAIDAIDTAATGGVVVLPNGYTFYLGSAVEVRADHCTVTAYGAQILGPSGGTATGDLFGIVDRRAASRVITDAHILGGQWTAANAGDNVLFMVSASHSSIEDAVVIMPTGHDSAGIIIENATTSTLSDVAVRRCTVHGGGGQSIAVSLQTAAGAIRRVQIVDVVCRDADIGIEVTGDLDARPVREVVIGNANIFNSTAYALSLVRLQDSTVSNVEATDCNWRGIQLYQPNNVAVSNIVLRSITTPTAAPTGFSGSAYGLITSAGTGSTVHKVANVHIVGAFADAFYVAAHDGQYIGCHMDGATEGVNNANAARTVWTGLTYENVTTPIHSGAGTTDVWQTRPQVLGATLPSAVSVDRGDADVTLTAGTDAVTQRFATTLTANRTVTLSTTGALRGDRFDVVRTGLGSYTLAVGALKTIPSATAAVVRIMYSGSAWVLVGYETL